MEIRPLTTLEFAKYRTKVIHRFSNEKIRSEGVDQDIATKAAEDAWERASANSAGQHIIGRLEVEKIGVGIIWFMIRMEWGQPCLWLYDIMIDSKHRGKGLGRKAMQLLEEEAKLRDIYTIGLHVFGQNTAARRLYESINFRPTSIVMRKDLDKTEESDFNKMR